MHTAGPANLFIIRSRANADPAGLLDLPSPEIDGAGDRIIISVGTVKFRINAGAGRDDHADGGRFTLDDGVGGKGGAQDNAVDRGGIDVFGDRR